MARQAIPVPTITHTEILARAIRSIELEIAGWREKCEGLPEKVFKDATANLFEKREALCTLYRIETGTDYV